MTPLALDLVVGFILLMSALIAYFRGIIKEAFTLVGLGLAVFATYKGAHLLVPGLNRLMGVPMEGSRTAAKPMFGFLTPEMMAKVAAYGGTFLTVFVVMTLLGMLLTRWTNEMGLGLVDRLLGAAFGVLRGFLLVFVVYVPFTYLIDQKKFPDWAKNSVSVPILQSTLSWANETWQLDKKIEDRGSGIAVKFSKIDPDKLGEGDAEAERELKQAIQKEEKEVQKAPPEGPSGAPATGEAPW